MKKKLHTDDIYKNRWQEYHLADGSVFDSRFINWRQLEWEKVIAIVTHIRGKKYLTHSKNPNFKFFVVYRWGGQIAIDGQVRPIHEWAVGYSDGDNCFMTDLDFKTGKILRRYIVPIEKVTKHIHPRVGGLHALITRV